MSERSTSPNPDPEPEEATGLEPGGSVPPGETPPDSGSVAPTEEAPAPKRPSGSAIPWAIFGVVLLVALLLFGGHLAGLFD